MAYKLAFDYIQARLYFCLILAEILRVIVYKLVLIKFKFVYIQLSFLISLFEESRFSLIDTLSRTNNHNCLIKLANF